MMTSRFLILSIMVFSILGVRAEVDPNFYIFLCFGQSNMEGAMPPEYVDIEYVDERFQTLATVDFSNPLRAKGQWYTAYPPIVRETTFLGVADYFGRTMVAALPLDYRVGVVNVAIGGTNIGAFLSEECANYKWVAPKVYELYGNDPYRHLVEMARIAQQSGVIKGILMHQGEANKGQQDWPEKVKKIYERLLNDLGINAEEVPLLVGEVVGTGEVGVHNTIIAKVPSVIPTAHIISSSGCPCTSDNMHFNAIGYRMMGKRYAEKMLELLELPVQMNPEYQLPNNLKRFFKATKLDSIDDLTLASDSIYKLRVNAYFEDEHTEDVTPDLIYYYTGGIEVLGDIIITVTNEPSSVTLCYTDFTNSTISSSFYVNKHNTDDIRSIQDETSNNNNIIYNLQGLKVAHPKKGLYIENGKLKMIKRD